MRQTDAIKNIFFNLVTTFLIFLGNAEKCKNEYIKQ